MYLWSPGRSNDIGLQLGKEGKGGGGMFSFLPLLHVHSCSIFFPVPLFHLFYYLFYLLETTQFDYRSRDRKFESQLGHLTCVELDHENIPTVSPSFPLIQ